MSDTDADDDDDGAYYVVHEEAIQYLPREWQEAIYARAEDGSKVLEADDKELKQLSRLSLSCYHVTVLNHIRDKLAAIVYRLEWSVFIELTMQTNPLVTPFFPIIPDG